MERLDTIYGRCNIFSLWVAAEMAAIAPGTIAIEDLCFNGIIRSLQILWMVGKPEKVMQRFGQMQQEGMSTEQILFCSGDQCMC